MPWYSNGWDDKSNRNNYQNMATFNTFRPASREEAYYSLGKNMLTSPPPNRRANSSSGYYLNPVSPYSGRRPYTYRDLLVLVRLLQGETRVGFAMLHDADADEANVVNNIICGSPADRAGLSIGDEIIEVNGVSVEGSNRCDIIQLIHECIKTRTIQLRVRRKQEVEIEATPPVARVTDAYLVSVDKDDKREVERRLRRNYPGINAHDMEAVHQRIKAGQAPVLADTNGRLANGTDDEGDAIPSAAVPPSPRQMERLKRYEDDLRQRKEQHMQQEREQEFLRTSLRGSKKLHSLESTTNGPVTFSSGFENASYEHSHDAISSLDKSPGVEEVMLSVGRVTRELEQMADGQDDAELLTSVFGAPPVRNAIDVTQAVRRRWDERPPADLPPSSAAPAARSAADVTEQLDEAISDSATELHTRLAKPHVQSVFDTHDRIAESFRTPERAASAASSHHAADQPSTSQQPPTPDCKETSIMRAADLPDNLRIITMLKPDGSFLGATVRNVAERVVVGRIVKGGVAERSQLMREGDELLEVNGHDVRGKTVNEVCDMLRCMSGEITMVISPAQYEHSDSFGDDSQQTSNVRHVRALFDYDPEDDYYLPCKELGVKLQKGDVLHVISTSDENWWQAYREGDDPSHSLAGIVPSALFQTRRERHRRELEKANSAAEVKPKSSSLCARRSKKTKARPTNVTHLGGANPKTAQSADEADDAAEVLSYEDVSLYLSRTGRKRPIVLVGPPNVGCLELRQKLMELDAAKFAGVIPHTSRPKKAGEQDGVHYHFVSRQKFQEDSRAGKFVEWGEFQKHLYGTSYESIRHVIEQGNTCVLTLKAQSLGSLRASTLMPFVVFISPPSLQQLRAQKQKQGAQNLPEEELKEIVTEGRRDEDAFGHLFDRLIVNVDLGRTFDELRQAIFRLETEPHWVPSVWLRHDASASLPHRHT